MIKTSQLSLQMEEEIRNDPTKPVKRIYNEVVLRENDIEDLPEFDNVRSRLTRTRSSLIPPIPQDAEDVILEA